jgi:DNA-binding NarL/FixJ family response regulator
VTTSISVAIADAQVLCRVGLCQILKEDELINIIGQAGNEKELLDIVLQKKTDVVIVDYNQPKYFDHTITQKLKEASPDTRILVISSDDRKDRIYQVLENGVNSFLTKQCDEAEILDAIRATSRGEKFYCHKILDLIMERSFPTKTEDTTSNTLTPREKEILTLVAKGKVAKEIAGDLNISTHTIYTHRKNILKKLGLTSPTEMVVYALENGLIELKM